MINPGLKRSAQTFIACSLIYVGKKWQRHTVKFNGPHYMADSGAIRGGWTS